MRVGAISAYSPISYIRPSASIMAASAKASETQSKYNNEDNPYQQNQKNIQGGFLRGMNLDMEV